MSLTRAFMKRIAYIGGQATKARTAADPDYYSRIGKLGPKARIGKKYPRKAKAAKGPDVAEALPASLAQAVEELDA